MRQTGKKQQPTLVGRGRFELPTSALSELRSNRLSYRPENKWHIQCSHAVPYEKYSFGPFRVSTRNIRMNKLMRWVNIP